MSISVTQIILGLSPFLNWPVPPDLWDQNCSRLTGNKRSVRKLPQKDIFDVMSLLLMAVGCHSWSWPAFPCGKCEWTPTLPLRRGLTCKVPVSTYSGCPLTLNLRRWFSQPRETGFSTTMTSGCWEWLCLGSAFLCSFHFGESHITWSIIQAYKKFLASTS